MSGPQLVLDLDLTTTSSEVQTTKRLSHTRGPLVRSQKTVL